MLFVVFLFSGTPSIMANPKTYRVLHFKEPLSTVLFKITNLPTDPGSFSGTLMFSGKAATKQNGEKDATAQLSSIILSQARQTAKLS